MVADRRRVDSTAGGTTPVIRICIGAILMWIIMAMIGHTIEAGRGYHRRDVGQGGWVADRTA